MILKKWRNHDALLLALFASASFSGIAQAQVDAAHAATYLPSKL